MTDRELMRQVLEDICGARLCEVNSMSSRGEAERLLSKAADALRERLAQPERELVIDCPRCGHCCPQRTWVDLTDEEIMEPWPFENRVAFARWLGAKLKDKNT